MLSGIGGAGRHGSTLKGVRPEARKIAEDCGVSVNQIKRALAKGVRPAVLLELAELMRHNGIQEAPSGAEVYPPFDTICDIYVKTGSVRITEDIVSASIKHLLGKKGIVEDSTGGYAPINPKSSFNRTVKEALEIYERTGNDFHAMITGLSRQAGKIRTDKE